MLLGSPPHHRFNWATAKLVPAHITRKRLSEAKEVRATGLATDRKALYRGYKDNIGISYRDYRDTIGIFQGNGKRNGNHYLGSRVRGLRFRVSEFWLEYR